jgi:hypothetical protein
VNRVGHDHPEYITALFYEADEPVRAIPKHPEAHLWPSAAITLGLLRAHKGVGYRALYRWLTALHQKSGQKSDAGVNRDFWPHFKGF